MKLRGIILLLVSIVKLSKSEVSFKYDFDDFKLLVKTEVEAAVHRMIKKLDKRSTIKYLQPLQKNLTDLYSEFSKFQNESEIMFSFLRGGRTELQDQISNLEDQIEKNLQTSKKSVDYLNSKLADQSSQRTILSTKLHSELSKFKNEYMRKTELKNEISKLVDRVENYKNVRGREVEELKKRNKWT